MKYSPATSIEEWFKSHAHDGEFVCPPRSCPYSVVGPQTDCGVVLFATKPVIVCAASDLNAKGNVLSVIGRYGLPDENDLRWIQEIVGRRKLIFLGDIDPPDLMIFAWLRDRMSPMRVEYAGISDRFLDLLGINGLESITIPWSQSERSSSVILEQIFADLEDRVGPKCFELIDREYKIEIDAVVSSGQRTSTALLLTNLLIKLTEDA